MRWDDEDDLGDLYLVDADGGGEMLLKSSTSDLAISMPDWSPSGGLLAANAFHMPSGEVGIVIVALPKA